MSHPARRPLVACLCAEWCDSCRQYRPTFEAVARRHAAAFEFAWIDIEDESDALGDPEIENFPTLLVEADGGLFLGPVTPQEATAERLLQTALAGGLPPAASPSDADLVSRVRHLLATRAATDGDRALPE